MRPGFLAPGRVEEIDRDRSSRAQVDWGLHDGLRLLQEALALCSRAAADECQQDKVIILVLLITLIVLIVLIFTAFFFFREDKEEQVTPLSPQLVVKESQLTFKLALDPKAERLEVIHDTEPKKIIARIAMDWPDPFLPGASGMACTARLQNACDMNLATVVARNVAVSGQALALCRSGCEIFGFVEPDTVARYHVRHRTGVHLMTLAGDFATWRVDALNPAGATICALTKEKGFLVGKVEQHIDSGLVICSVLAAHIHRILQQRPQAVANPLPRTVPDLPPLRAGKGQSKGSITEVEEPISSGLDDGRSEIAESPMSGG